MSEERTMILRMLKEGKISEEEALKLLDAVGETDTTKEDASFMTNAQEWADKLSASIDKFVKKTNEKINGIDLNNLGDFTISTSNPFAKYKSNTRKEFTPTIAEGDAFSIKIQNEAGKISVLAADVETVNILAEIAYNEKLVHENYEFLLLKQEAGELSLENNSAGYKKIPYEMHITVTVPKKQFQNLELNSLNHRIEITGIDVKTLGVANVNGEIVLNDLHAEQTRIDSTNGAMRINGISGQSLETNATNGRIHILSLDVEKTNAHSVNGGITIQFPGQSAREIFVESTNGRIFIDIEDFKRAIKVDVRKAIKYTGNIYLSDEFSSVSKEDKGATATTASYAENLEDKLVICTKILNGRVIVE